MTDRPVTCYHCGDEGHFARNCNKKGTIVGQQDNRKNEESKCFRCGEVGHFARECTQEDKREPREPREPREYREPREPREYREPREPREYREPREPREPRKQYGGGGGREKCFNCGRFGHFARQCNSAKRMQCYNCRNEGHLARDCPEGDKKGKDECHKCHEIGHFARNCASMSFVRQIEERLVIYSHYQATIHYQATSFIIKPLPHYQATSFIIKQFLFKIPIILSNFANIQSQCIHSVILQ